MNIYSILATIGALVSTTSAVGCIIFLLDEPEAPESML